jgi:hypothetical protein
MENTRKLNYSEALIINGIALCFIVFFTCNCSVQKRHYRNGYYVSFKHTASRSETVYKVNNHQQNLMGETSKTKKRKLNFCIPAQVPSANFKSSSKFNHQQRVYRVTSNCKKLFKNDKIELHVLNAPERKLQIFTLRAHPSSRNNFWTGREVFTDIGLVLGILTIMGMTAALIFDFIPVFALPMIIVNEVVMVISKSKWKSNKHTYTNKGAHVLAVIFMVLSVLMGIFCLIYFAEFSL